MSTSTTTDPGTTNRPGDATEGPRVLIADSFQPEGIEALEAIGCDVQFDPGLGAAELPDRISGCNPDILVVRSTKVNQAAIEAASRLSLILRAGAGYDTIDLDTASRNGVSVANCPGMNAIAVAELAWSLILGCDRRVPDQTRDLRAGQWDKKGYAKARGLHGRTLGIIGMGRIGQAVAERGRAFGMKVVAWSRSLDPVEAEAMGVTACADAYEVARQSDVVSLHVAATPETVGMIDASFLDAMQDGAILVNTTRGSLVDEAALAEAIDRKGLRVGLDVYADEPGSGETNFTNTLLDRPGVYGTHHVGASTDQAQDAIASEAVRVVTHYIATGKVLHCVNLASRTAASVQLAVRHHNKPGVLAFVFEIVGQAGINVEEMENVIFDGGCAACARIQLGGILDEGAIDTIRAHEHVISVTLTPISAS